MSGLFLSLLHLIKEILLAKNVDSAQTPHYRVSDLGLHCLPMTLLRIFWLECVNLFRGAIRMPERSQIAIRSRYKSMSVMHNHEDHG